MLAGGGTISEAVTVSRNTVLDATVDSTDGTWSDNRSEQGGVSQTTKLVDISHEVNIGVKTTGMSYYNTTTNKIVFADGNTAGAVWVDATGATAHTPV